MWSTAPSREPAPVVAPAGPAQPDPDGAPPERPRRGPLAVLRGALALVALLAAAGTLAGFAPRLAWPCELAGAHRVLLLAVLALAGVVAAARRRFLLALGLLLLAAANALPLRGLYEETEALPPAGVRNLRLVVLNVHARNDRTADAIAWLREQQPDVVVLLEVTEPWARALEGLADVLPHRLVLPRADNFGIAVLTRLRTRGLVEWTPPSGVPAVDARLQVGAEVLRLLAVHPPPPFGPTLVERRDADLAALAAEVAAGRAADPGPVIVAGDLNAAPWSYALDPLRADAGLRRLGQGRGLAATWPAHLLGGLVPPWVPLDGALATDDVRVSGYAVGPYLGSDHRPVVVDVLLR